LAAPNGAADRHADLAESMVTVWNEELAKHLAKPRKLDQTRKGKLTKRLREDFGNSLEQWRRYCQRIRGSPHLIGQNDRGWRADLDWCLEPSHVTRILEGRYDRRDVRPEPEPRRTVGLGFDVHGS
jgi:hypothetical protein